MQDLQKIFIDFQKKKAKLKKLREFFKEQYEQNLEYREIVEKMEPLNIKKKSIKTSINEMCQAEYTEMEDLKIDIASDKEMINDLVLSTYMKGETIELVDQHEQQVLPMFDVKFTVAK